MPRPSVEVGAWPLRPERGWWRRRESNPRPGIPAPQASTCVFHGLDLVLRTPVDGLPSDQSRWCLAGPPRGATRRPARWWRLRPAAGVPGGDGCLTYQAAREKLLACNAAPRGFSGVTRDPRHATWRQVKPVETGAPPFRRGRSLAHGMPCPHASSHRTTTGIEFDRRIVPEANRHSPCTP